MKSIKFIVSGCLLLAGFVSTAQSDEGNAGPKFKSWSVGVQAVHLYDLPVTRFDGKLSQDLQGLNGDKTSFDLGVDVYVEKMFTPLFGVQLGGRFGSMTGANDVEYYTNDFYEVQLDGLFYLSNIDALHVNSRWNYYVKAGAGNGMYSAEQFLISDDSPDNTSEGGFWATRLGAGVQYELNSFLRLELEAGYNWVRNDGFDGFNNATGSDSYLATGLGLAYTFGKKKVAPMYATNYFGGEYIPIEGATAPRIDENSSATNDEALDELKNQLKAQQEQLTALEKQNSEQQKRIEVLKSSSIPISASTSDNTVLVSNNNVLSTEVFFAFDSSILSNDAKRNLANALSGIEEKEKLSVKLIGYADKVGNDKYNKLLKERRANAVKSFLVQIGFNHANISTSLGQTSAFKTENQFLNRKVKVQVK